MDIREANSKAEADLRGERGDLCYLTDKGWAQVTKVRTSTHTRRTVDGDGAETLDVEEIQVVYLDTITGKRQRVKVDRSEISKLRTAPRAEAEKAPAPGGEPARDGRRRPPLPPRGDGDPVVGVSGGGDE